MPLEHTLLDPSTLSDAAQRVLAGPGPARMMAARGLAPLARPADLLSVLYQLAHDPEAPLAEAADKSARGLPDKILLGALGEPTLDARVLDWFGGALLTRPAVLEPILLNATTADETIARLVARLGDKEVDLIAGNEQRLLRAPEIIAAMYMNPRARMSTVDRAVELAVRNQLVVPGIPSWDAIVHAVLGTLPASEDDPAATVANPTPVVDAVVADAAFSQAAAQILDETDDAARVAAELAGDENDEIVSKEAKKLQIDKLSVPGKVRLATLGNAFARSVLIRDSNKVVAMAAVRSPKVTDDEILKYAGNRGLNADVIRLIATNRGWTRMYPVKVALVSNPKCPLPLSMRFLPLLQMREIKAVAGSKGVPSALVIQAKKLVALKAH